MAEERTMKVAGRRLSPRWLLVAILILYVLLVGLYSWLTPPFEGPDEPQHVAYIQWLAEGKGFPPQGDAAWSTDIEQEAGQPPLYYLLASIPARFIDISNPRTIYNENPHFPGVLPRLHWLDGQTLRFTVDNDNNVVPLADGYQPWQGGWLALRLARVLTLAFGLLLLVSVYGLGRQVAPDAPDLALAATLLVAVTPQVIFISSVVSNDIPAAALSSLTLWLLAILVRQGPGWPKAFFVGVAFGLAILTKVSAVALALPIAGALLWLWLSGRQSIGQVIRTGLFMVLGTLAVAGWWFARSLLLYGSPLGLETHDQTPWAINLDPERLLATPLARWQDVFRSFWIALGWGTIRPAAWTYSLLLVAMVTGLIGLLVAAFRWWRQPGRRLTTTIILLLISLLAIVGVAAGLEVWMRRVVASYGRLMFPAIAAIAILSVVGWRALHKKLPLVMIALVALLAIAAPFWLLRPAFARPETNAADPQADTIGWFYGPVEQPFAELLSARVSVESATGGEIVPVELCWRVLQQSDGPASVLVHFIGPQNTLAANRRSHPGMGNYPTTIWQPGQEFCDLMPVYISKRSLPASLLYKVEIAMLDDETQERLPVHDTAGNEILAAFAGGVQLLLHEEDERRIIYSPDLSQGSESFQLISYDLDRNWQQGERQKLTLYWGINRAVDQDYQVFVHLRDPDSGQTVAQGDGPPAAGWHPTSWWLVGRGVADEHAIDVTGDIRPGEYALVAGFYDVATGQRVSPEYELGLVTIEE